MEKEKNYGSNCIGFVVRIISPTKLIIDIGEDVLTVGDKVQVYEASDEIFDLNGNSLGVYENIKETLTVTYTSTEYSVCSHQVEKTENKLTQLLINNPVLDSYAPRTIIKDIDLPVREEDINPLKLDESKYIKTGDPVKKS